MLFVDATKLVNKRTFKLSEQLEVTVQLYDGVDDSGDKGPPQHGMLSLLDKLLIK